MQVFNNLTVFFEEALEDINCRPDTKSYLIHLYCEFKTINNDLSHQNLTLLYAQAKSHNDFHLHQQIGDYVFWVKTMIPTHFNNTNDYYENMARLSYFSCYKLLNRKWLLYEDLADNFRILENQARHHLHYFHI